MTRDLLFAPVSTSSEFLKREMTLTLAGAKKGFLPNLDLLNNNKDSDLIPYKFWEGKAEGR